MKAYVYKIINKETEKYYVGSTINLKQRIARHFSELRSNKHHNFVLQDDYNKFGDNSFTIEIVKVFNTDDEAKILEQKIIDENYDVIYNLGKYATYGKDLVSYHPKHEEISLKHSINTKYKYCHMSDAEKKYISEMFSGKKNPMYGKHHTKEAIKKIKDANYGRIPYNKDKTLEECFGKEKAKSIREKESSFAKTRIGKLNPFYGKSHSKETKLKISNANKGKIPPNRYKVKINGIVYPALTIAAKELGLNPSTVLYRIRSKSFINYIKL